MGRRAIAFQPATGNIAGLVRFAECLRLARRENWQRETFDHLWIMPATAITL